MDISDLSIGITLRVTLQHETAAIQQQSHEHNQVVEPPS